MTHKTVTFLCLLVLLNSTLLQGQASYLGTEMFGKASFYENVFYGKKTANGEILKKNMLTCAHQTLPFGTMLEVTNLTNNNSCIVRVNDRGPFIKKRVLDLTHAAARRLNMLHHGVVNVKITIVGQNNKVYIASAGSMIKSSADLMVNEPHDGKVKVPMKPRHKTILSKPSRAANKKRAMRRSKTGHK
ncbi:MULTISPECIES: septal ring lytic transglycosylase RlpA family protein [Emticicia]|uniref:septal ring lytic transglycosylase RlpA family protein n=1 Tax=Emticicia TaxID=312278 RepID=UPI00209F239C|nr:MULTISPECIES: septal ring lytic transglycosylase RlpA family protein [Emticicia]UTA69450.1 septal ring lytic transglycosylase RlpA family protein [Emticicia sp. 21SJ11W-3]